MFSLKRLNITEKASPRNIGFLKYTVAIKNKGAELVRLTNNLDSGLRQAEGIICFSGTDIECVWS